MIHAAAVFEHFKTLITGRWTGEGFAHYPTIQDTGYTEVWTFRPDETKQAIHFEQKTLYKNETPDNGQTVFWDTGFILLKEDRILLVSAQSGGRTETYELDKVQGNQFTFNLQSISNDIKTTRSQRILSIEGPKLEYALNMQLKEVPVFQNHLKATLTLSDNPGL